ncbi:MAG: amino acid ABC transporter ATP-binding protein [Rhizobiaceae bacterium]|nr:amino acid ABC transporter ATP-binding protein [Rhizobiaceae bacterium]
MKQPILVAKKIRKSFGQKPVLKGVDLEVEPGEVVALIGSSGSGKSTFLRCLNFLEMPQSGSITFGGASLCDGEGESFRIAPERQLRAARAQMPMVFQQFNLFGNKTVLQNLIEGPLVVLRQNREETVSRALEVLNRFGLSDKESSYPGELSGGQQQRVAIARAVMMNPRLILFDEPTSALDPELVAGVLNAIQTLANEGMTMIIVTHEMGFARKLADVVHFMSDGQIAESGPAEQIFSEPRTEPLKKFLRTYLTG